MSYFVGTPPRQIVVGITAKRAAMRFRSTGLWRSYRTGHAAILSSGSPTNPNIGRISPCPREWNFFLGCKIHLTDRADCKKGGRKLLTPQGPVWSVDGLKNRRGVTTGKGGIQLSGPWRVRFPSRSVLNSCLRWTYRKGGVIWQAFPHFRY